MERGDIRCFPCCSLCRQIKQSDTRSGLVKEEVALSQLHTLLKALEPIVPTFSPREERALLHDATKLFQMSQNTSELMGEVYGFTLALRKSSLQDGGRGVFVSSGTVPEKHIVGLYPGEGRDGDWYVPVKAFVTEPTPLIGS